jgi:hypothetical protein
VRILGGQGKRLPDKRETAIRVAARRIVVRQFDQDIGVVRGFLPVRFGNLDSFEIALRGLFAIFAAPLVGAREVTPGAIILRVQA